MVKIRLRRVGKKGQPEYRVVVTNSESPRDGRFIEIIGHYSPLTDPATMSVQPDRALYWLGQGAQPSQAVLRILTKQGVMDTFQRTKAGEPAVEATAEGGQA